MNSVLNEVFAFERLSKMAVSGTSADFESAAPQPSESLKNQLFEALVGNGVV